MNVFASVTPRLVPLWRSGARLLVVASALAAAACETAPPQYIVGLPSPRNHGAPSVIVHHTTDDKERSIYDDSGHRYVRVDGLWRRVEEIGDQRDYFYDYDGREYRYVGGGRYVLVNYHKTARSATVLPVDSY